MKVSRIAFLHLIICIGRSYEVSFVSIICQTYLKCPFYAGDNVIVGSREGKLCWFDMDLSSQPYRVLKYVMLLFAEREMINKMKFLFCFLLFLFNAMWLFKFELRRR